MDQNQYDFFKIIDTSVKKDNKIVSPMFLNKRSKDLMIRGGKFYAIVDKKTGYWIQDEYVVQEIVDAEMRKFASELEKHKSPDTSIVVRTMESSKSKSWIEYKTYINNLPDNYHQLDDKLCFDQDTVDPKDYISKRLPYKLKNGSCEAWNQIVGTLYAPDEKQKIEWAIGSVIAGDSKDIQKFIVLYGDPGAGKGTIIKIIQMLFPGYYEMFDAKSLSSSSNAFAFEQFRTNPLIALQTDGDLSRIEDNTKLNSLVSHETVVMNEKRKQSYNFTPRCFLFMASNKPVDITDTKSGLKRRLIDVSPTGQTVPKREYDRLMNQISYELSGTAWRCLEVYRKLGKNFYNDYKPYGMMEKTNALYNFVLDNVDVLNRPEGIFVGEAYEEWVKYCSQTGILNYMKRHVFKEELKDYYIKFEEFKKTETGSYRGWYTGIDFTKLKNGFKGQKAIDHEGTSLGLVLDQKVSLLDDMLKDCQAQYGVPKPDGGSKPEVAWDFCKTTVKDLDTTRLHFIRVPKNHIVIDFDLKNEKGEKDALLNLEAAETFPRTYAEYSQGGKGLHLHYIYDGDPEELDQYYEGNKDIEIKVYTGKLSLRRRLSLCNNIPVRTISGGLTKKEGGKKDTIDFTVVENEKHLINIIRKCLNKEIEQKHTAPAMSLIEKTLDDAYKAGISYDIRNLRPAISAFAAKSSHQKDTCMKIANRLHYCSKDYEKTTDSTKVTMDQEDIQKELEFERKDQEFAKAEKEIEDRNKILDAIKTLEGPSGDFKPAETRPIPQYSSEEYVFFDIEVFPNLLLVNWKEAGDSGMVRMTNPTREEIGELFRKKLIGFNCRRYDNHILYARYLGWNNAAIYQLSNRIITKSQNAMFGNAYDLSYTDVYDFAAKKQSLKKWEIELGIHHQELGIPWDQPVPEDRWKEISEYCDNDVIATEAVFNHLAGDFKARQILADIAGMKVNDTTNQLTTRIIFGDDPRPQAQFNYPDLTKEFPGYRFESGKSYYRHDITVPKTNYIQHIEKIQEIYKDRVVNIDEQKRVVTVDEEIGEGGRVYAVPGVYHNVTTFDVASMHPSSIIAENGFGKYTERFKQLLDIRIAIKHKDFERAKTMLDGKLAKYLDDPGQAKALSQALKIAINSVYGLTAAGFDNKFKDPRNKDNWVAKRGALFIETLRLKVLEMGGKVVHIKTDSIKVVDPSEEVSQFILDYGKQWGYTFEIEDIYEKMCLVNDAVYIALRDKKDPSWLDECEKARKKAKEKDIPYQEPTRWTATGAQFAHPYVFKALFSHEPLEFMDLCETKSVTDAALYLDFNENLTDVSAEEKERDKIHSRMKKLLKEVDDYPTFKEWDTAYQFSTQKIGKNGRYSMKVGIEDAEKIYAELADLPKDIEVLNELIAKGHNYVFIGRAGSFCPVRAGQGGGILCREKDGKYSAATGSKGYRWREGESLLGADRMDMIDMGYFEGLAKTAREAVGEYAVKIGSSFEEFASEEEPPFDDESITKSRKELESILQ